MCALRHAPERHCERLPRPVTVISVMETSWLVHTVVPPHRPPNGHVNVGPDQTSAQRRNAMDLGLQGARVLVTAGAGGIGLEIARAFLREGARVHVCDIAGDTLKRLKQTDPELTESQADVADRADVKRLLDEALGALGGLDVLVNNAGIAGPTGRVEEINPEDWDRTLQVCITGQYNCARLAIPHLRKSANASIVNLSSAAGKLRSEERRVGKEWRYRWS